MDLIAVAVGNYRSVGEEPIWVDLEKRANVLIGANNSGKSNVLKSLLWVGQARPGGNLAVQDFERHRRDTRLNPQISVRVRKDPRGDEPNHLPDVLESKLELGDHGLACIRSFFDQVDLARFNAWCNRNKLPQFAQASSIEQAKPQKLNCTLHIVAALLRDKFPAVRLLPQFRKIERSGVYEPQGTGLIERLANWQQPPLAVR